MRGPWGESFRGRKATPSGQAHFWISEVVLSAELVPFGGQSAPLCMPQAPVTPHRRRAVSPCCAGRRWPMSVLPWHGLVGVRPRRSRLGRRLIQC